MVIPLTRYSESFYPIIFVKCLRIKRISLFNQAFETLSPLLGANQILHEKTNFAWGGVNDPSSRLSSDLPKKLELPLAENV